jgi:hypothetical protein
MTNEIVIYQNDHLKSKVEALVVDETIWLTQSQIVFLFESSKANISEHIKHIFQSRELDESASVRKFRTVQIEGKRNVERERLHYSLDVIISVGYRVNSIRGTQFRIWANKVLKNYLLKGYSVQSRINHIENKFSKLSEKVDAIELQIKTDSLPQQGIFYDGQIYDAYQFVNNLIKKAKTSIILIDNYIDDTVITQLTAKHKEVKVYLLSKNFSTKLQLDIKKANEQYPQFKAISFTKAHDRFIIIDKKEVYHIGASLKDLGKKWFAFSKMELGSVNIIQELEELV